MGHQFSQRSLRNLEQVHPDLQRVMQRAIEISDLDFVVIEGKRSRARQAQLLAEGATRTMRSRHLTGHAVDIVPLLSGQPDWSWPLYHRLAVDVKRAAREVRVPIEWGGDWTSFKDGPHFQLPRNRYPADTPEANDDEVANRFQDPVRPQPDRTISAASGVGVAGATVAADNAVEAGASGFDEVASGNTSWEALHNPVFFTIGMIIVVLAIYIIWRRWRAWKVGKRESQFFDTLKQTKDQIKDQAKSRIRYAAEAPVSRLRRIFTGS